jgi:hypothetical protein
VLRPFSEAAEEVEALLARALEMVEVVLAEGMEAALSRFHAAEPGARARARRERETALAPADGQQPEGGEPA